MSKFILTYHRIGETKTDYNNTCISISEFEQQIIYLKSHTKILKMGEFLEYSGDDTAVSVTFDDGYEKFVFEVLPILEKYCIPVTIFITPQYDKDNEFWMSDIIRILYEGEFENGNIGLNFRNKRINLSLKNMYDRVEAYDFFRRLFRSYGKKDKQEVLVSLHDQSGVPWSAREDYRPFTREQIKLLAQNELVTIGAHTVSHPSLGYLDESEQKREIENSIIKLRQLTGVPVNYFAYPFGGIEDYNQTTKFLVAQMGIKAAFTTEERAVNFVDDRFAIPRINSEKTNIREWISKIQKILGNQAKEKKKNNFYFGSREKDESIRNASKIIICGCGEKAKEVLTYFKEQNLQDKVVAYVDKNSLKVGGEMDNISVCAYEDFFCDDTVDWVIQNRYDFQIVDMLCDNNIKNIHWWI